MTDAEDRGDECTIGRIRSAVMHERSIDFQGVQRKPLHQSKTGVAGSEVVHRHINPETATLFKMTQDPLGMVHDAAFGELEFQQRSVVPNSPNNAPQLPE